MANKEPIKVEDFPVLLPPENYEFIKQMQEAMNSKNKQPKEE